jgi:uncharacterized protein YjcR
MTTDKQIRERAEELYVINGLTLEAVAEETGVPSGSIKRWAAEGGWKAKQREYRDAEAEIKRYSRLARLKLIKDAMTSLNPQKIYAFAALERASQGHLADFDESETTYGEVEIKTPQEAISALQEAISRKLNLMLAKPDAISLSAIKDMKKAMELVDQMRAEYGAEPEKEVLKGNDEEQARFWREKVLGVK